jgi:uncharacterized protein YwgA
MTDQPHELLAEIIDAHGGELVGRIRLQKVIYLLDQLGLASGFEYSYHHYGPYSSEVSSALLDAESAGVVQDQIKFRQSDGASYSVFHSQLDRQPEKVGNLDRPATIALLGQMKAQSATVLELAATIHWLRSVERVDDWQAELVSRKGSKTGSGRQEQAVELLKSLELF